MHNHRYKKQIIVLTLMSAVIFMAAGCAKTDDSSHQTPSIATEVSSPLITLIDDENATFSVDESYTQEPDSPAFNSAKDITIDGCRFVA